MSIPFIRSGAALRAAMTALALFGATSFAAAHEFKIGDIEIAHPWSRATPPGAKVAAGYATITNKGATPDKLIAVTGDIGGKGEIHQMAVDANGVMTMRPVQGGVEIPAGGTVELKPGAFHLMFMDLNRLPKEGEKFKGTMTFEKAGKVDVEYSVDKVGGESGHKDQKGHKN